MYCSDHDKEIPDHLWGLHMRLQHKSEATVATATGGERKMSAQERMNANLCANGDHPLAEPRSGGYHSTTFPIRYICCACAGHKAEDHYPKTIFEEAIETEDTFRDPETGLLECPDCHEMAVHSNGPDLYCFNCDWKQEQSSSPFEDAEVQS